MGSAGSGRPGVHSHRDSTDLRSAYPIAQAIEFIEHTCCTARPFMSSAHVLGIGELLGKILDEGPVPGGLVTDAVIVAACAASMASTQCCPTTATSTAFRIPGSRGSASDRPMYYNCDCSLGVQALVAVNSSQRLRRGLGQPLFRPDPCRRWILKIPVAPAVVFPSHFNRGGVHAASYGSSTGPERCVHEKCDPRTTRSKARLPDACEQKPENGESTPCR